MSFFELPPIIERMLLVSDKISDLNFSVGQLPQVEINGKLTPVQPLGMQKLTPYQTEIIALTLMNGNPDAAERLARSGTADLSYSLPSRARFRVNIFQQRGVYSIVMRVIPTDIPTLKSLGLPPHPSGEHVRTGVNDGYFARWRSRRNPYRALDRRRTIARWEAEVRRFGYSLVDTDRAEDLPLPGQAGSPNANRR